jgi:hypothetical protein
MAPLSSPGAIRRRPFAPLIVREPSIVLEPLVRDPFADESSDRHHRTTRGVITPQCALVRASLLRLADREEPR